jgi:hypothetical protein
VAVLEWDGKEVNLLVGSTGLLAFEDEARLAREFVLPAQPPLTVLLADPFDLLRNKLSVNRPKDQPHIVVLRRFLDEEVVHAFEQETDPRRRLAPAERLLDVLGAASLPLELADRLLPLARTAADLRFLAHRVPTKPQLDAVVARATEPASSATVQRIAATRRFDG